MADQFVGEIRIFGCNFAPVGWALCDGSLLPISQNTALFSLLGTNFGGDGTTNFGLPNLQGRLPVGFGQGPGLSSYSLGQIGGAPTVTILGSTLAAHTHAPAASTVTGTQTKPAGNIWATAGLGRQQPPLYTAPVQLVAMNAQAILPAPGGGQPHNNLSPYLTMYFCIALQGIYPARS